MLLGSYVHSKTGNIYQVLDMAFSRFQDGDDVPTDHHLIAHCSENKDVQVKVYKQGNIYWYVNETSSALHENNKTKVLYERDGVYWLRSVNDFNKVVDINGIQTPRFVKHSNVLQTS